MNAQNDAGGRQALVRVALAAVLVTYCTLATLQSLATRLQWGPDEPGHIIYVRSLALDGRFPALTHGEEDNAYVPGAARTHEAHQPPLYYALAAVVWRAFARLPDQTVTFTDGSGAVQSFSVPGAVRPVRLLSVLFGAVALAFISATARVVFPGRPAVWIAGTALAAFTPMFTYITGVINNDSLLAALFAGVAWQWARILRAGANRRDIVTLGLLLGAAMSVKETAVALVLVSLAVLAWEPGAGSWRRRLAHIGGVVGLTILVAGWWFARKWLVWGSPLVYPYVYPLLGLPAEQRAALLSALPRLVFLFTFVPADVIGARLDLGLLTVVFLSIAVLSAGGLALAFVRRERLAMPRHEALSLALWVATAGVVLAGLLRNVMTVDWRMGTSGGRYLVCVLPLLALASARGLSALFGEGRGARIGLAIVGILLLGLNVAAIWATAAVYGTLR